MVESTAKKEVYRTEQIDCGVPEEFKETHGITAHMHPGSAPKAQPNPAKQTIEVAALLF